MKTSASLFLPPLPSMQAFAAWNELAVKTGEMLFASAQVIGHRVLRMALAGPLPNKRDRREFLLMGSEKVDAALKSAAAMGAQWLGLALGGGFGARAWNDWVAAANAAFACAGSRTPQEAFERQAKLARSFLASAASLDRLGHAGMHLAGHGLKPIHAAATANAKRLSRG